MNTALVIALAIDFMVNHLTGGLVENSTVGAPISRCYVRTLGLCSHAGKVRYLQVATPVVPRHHSYPVVRFALGTTGGNICIPRLAATGLLVARSATLV